MLIKILDEQKNYTTSQNFKKVCLANFFKCVSMIFKRRFQKYYQFFSIIDRFKDTTTFVFYDFPLTVDFFCSYACCDLSLPALSCCKSVFY